MGRAWKTGGEPDQMTRAGPTSYRGVAGLEIEDGTLRAVVLPSIGGKMSSLRLKSTGREFMWQDPGKRLRIPLTAHRCQTMTLAASRSAFQRSTRRSIPSTLGGASSCRMTARYGPSLGL